MKTALCLLLILSAALPALPSATARRQDDLPAAPIRRHERPIPGSYVVVLKPGVGAERVAPLAKKLASLHGGQLAATYRHALRGFSVRLTEKAAVALSRHPLVEYVEEDGVVETAGVTQQNAPWGLDRVDQRSLPLSTTYTYVSTGDGVRVYVIDTGIRTTHEEFGGRASVAFDNVNDGQNGEDCHGHGTKVAAVVGGQTYGVAKGVELRAVRVFGCDNRTTLTRLLGGVDWVTGNYEAPAVAVLSISAGGSSAIDTAVQNSIAAGVTYVVAAGNINDDAGTKSPARVPEALTVGATDQADTRATFSNYGAALDLFAPGVDIPTATHFDDTATAVESGTSMAAAHAAGAAARYLEGNGLATPAAVNQAVIDDATPGKVSNPGPGSPNLLLHVSGYAGLTPTLAATKVDSYQSSPASAEPGERITYAVTVSNAGTSDATDVMFTDTVDPQTTLDPFSVSPSTAAINGGTLTVALGSLPAGQSATITFQVVVNNPFTGAQQQVSNQGTVTADGGVSVLTDDPDVLGQVNPTITPVALPPDISVKDSRVSEPASGFSEMVFAVALSRPAPSGGVSVDFATSDGTAVGGAGSQGDYVATSGTLTFAPGQRLKSVSVPVRQDGTTEPDETFLVNLSNPNGGVTTDSQGVGTITGPPAAAGGILISEIRTSGPAGGGDDFVEIYNNSDSPLTVTTTDGSPGWGLFKMGAGCDATPTLVGTVPNGTNIPGRGHYLLTGPQYSLKDYGGTDAALGDATLGEDIESDRNVALFSTTNVANLSVLTRLDAVGFGANSQENCNLLREGSNLGAAAGSALEHSYFRKLCDFVNGAGCLTNGTPKDTQENASDFMFADTSGTAVAGAGQRLGAPGPENLASPRGSDNVSMLVLDNSKSSTSAPNRVRNLNDTGPNKTYGTISIRRRVVNNTGTAVTRLRFRVTELTSFPRANSTLADVRMLSSTAVSVPGVTDAQTCLAANGTATTPCTVTVQGTTLEGPPAQPYGGAYNSSLAAGTITLGAPLPSGASVNLQFLLGVEQSGTFRFYIIVEALP